MALSRTSDLHLNGSKLLKMANLANISGTGK